MFRKGFLTSVTFFCKSFLRKKRQTKKVRFSGNASLIKPSVNRFRRHSHVKQLEQTCSNESLKEILEQSQLKKKSILRKSGTLENKNEEPPDFDCNIGVNLSDSESSGDEDAPIVRKVVVQNEEPEQKNLISNINQASGSKMNLQKNFENLAAMEKSKQMLLNYKSKATKNDNDAVDVSDLLAMGESSKSQSHHKKKVAPIKEKNGDSDSDWEEVEGKECKIKL